MNLIEFLQENPTAKGGAPLSPAIHENVKFTGFEVIPGDVTEFIFGVEKDGKYANDKHKLPKDDNPKLEWHTNHRKQVIAYWLKAVLKDDEMERVVVPDKLLDFITLVVPIFKNKVGAKVNIKLVPNTWTNKKDEVVTTTKFPFFPGYVEKYSEDVPCSLKYTKLENEAFLAAEEAKSDETVQPSAKGDAIFFK